VQSGNTAVHYAAKFGHLDLVELLLGCGRPIEVSMLNKVGVAPLPHIASHLPSSGFSRSTPHHMGRLTGTC
jgi:hypothetical protein